MRDIARRLNVSHATVSMALRNNPRISQKRRDEVRKIAEEVGYRPDPMLSSLVAYRQRKQSKPVVSTLAWVNRWVDPKMLRGYKEFDEYWKGAVAAAEQLGYKVEEFVVNEKMRGRRLNDILLARGIQGILIPPHSSDAPWTDIGIEWEKFSIVRFGFSILDLRAHMIGSDQMRGAELAVRKIVEAGYQSIGFVSNARFDMKTGSNFRMGYMHGIEMNPQLRRIEPLILEEPLPETGDSQAVRSQIQDWIKREKVDAVLTSEVGLAAALKLQGIRVPEDVALASTSVLEFSGINAGIDQNPYEIGQTAVQVLVGRLNRNDQGEPEVCRRVLVEGKWVAGNTLPIIREEAEVR